MKHLVFFFVQVNQPVSLHFSVTHPTRTLHWLLSQYTTARRSKNTTLSAYSSSLFATSCKASPGNLQEIVRSCFRAFVRFLAYSFVCLSLGHSQACSFCSFFVRWFVRAFVFSLRTFARKFSNIDFFLKILPLKDDELVMSEM